MSNETFTKEEVMARYKVSRNTVDRWVTSGRLPHLKLGRSVRITEANLAHFEKNHLVKGVA